MKILKLRKVKLGDDYPIIRVTYKTFLTTIQRDVIKDGNHWIWSDTGWFCQNDCLLNKFSESSQFEYVLNGKD